MKTIVKTIEEIYQGADGWFTAVASAAGLTKGAIMAVTSITLLCIYMIISEAFFQIRLHAFRKRLEKDT